MNKSSTSRNSVLTGIHALVPWYSIVPDSLKFSRSDQYTCPVLLQTPLYASSVRPLTSWRACVAQICRGMLVFLFLFWWCGGGGGGERKFFLQHMHFFVSRVLSEIDQTCRSCFKTSLLIICIMTFFDFTIFLFYATSTIKKYPKRVFRLYFRRFLRCHLRQALTYSSLRLKSAVKTLNQIQWGSGMRNLSKFTKIVIEKAVFGTSPKRKTAQIYIMSWILPALSIKSGTLGHSLVLAERVG